MREPAVCAGTSPAVAALVELRSGEYRGIEGGFVGQVTKCLSVIRMWPGGPAAVRASGSGAPVAGRIYGVSPRSSGASPPAEPARPALCRREMFGPIRNTAGPD
ncbi:hypothetical protein GCM10023322_69780 [Rugosimonospora acidiphila]|uniref:Uncharacterized protein n=1 Tax=Rugosimonospora acidiphila TaxID=556531 RepID=A0ABP9SMM2_9ACTN